MRKSIVQITSSLFKDFVEKEKSAGILLIACTLVSILLSNLPVVNHYYQHIWESTWLNHSLTHWINDGLMAIFFLMIGLELEREVYIGQLSTLKDALLPVVAALGGMLVPAAIYLFFNQGSPYISGFGIPMATDIAFALAVLSLLGNKVPLALKIFLTALAVIDDLGAVICIALFYTKTLHLNYLWAALAIFGLLLVLNRIKIRILSPYLVGGILMWYCLLHAGVHATIAGVLTAFAIPFGNGDENSTSFKLQHFLHKPVAFLILPLFALANTVLPFNYFMVNTDTKSVAFGIFIGLLFGKPIGIFLFSYIGYKFGLLKLNPGLTWYTIFAVSWLGGVGFTMSIFISILSFENIHVLIMAKWIILSASIVSGITGYWVLKKILK